MITGEQFLIWCKEHIWPILIGLSFFIQIIPIKLNPWSALLGWIGKMLNGDLNKKIDKLNKDMNELSTQRKEDEKDRIRWEILDFANSCRNNRRHTKDEFQHIITLKDKYKKLLQETNDTNGVFDAEYEYIKKIYTERQEKNDFL